MTDRFVPRDETELGDVLSWAAAGKTPLEIFARGTKRGLGRPVQAAHGLDLSNLAGVIDYEPSELILTARPATPLAEIAHVLGQAGQRLDFEPPDLSAIYASADRGTLGGAISCNLSGPRRIKTGAARDHFLGFSAISGRGEAFKAGGKVVKNVTGFDLPKLMAGAFGTLACLTEVTVKVLPAPETSVSVVLHGLSPETAVEAMTSAMNSPHDVSGAAHLPEAVARTLAGDLAEADGMTLLRIEGTAPSVKARSEALSALLRPFGVPQIVDAATSRAWWRDVRDLRPVAAATTDWIWRVSVPPSAGARLVADVLRSRPAARYMMDWAGGLVIFAIPPANTDSARPFAVRESLEALKCGGHATLLRAAETVRRASEVFQPPAPGMAALSARVKAAFDPHGILNPGRLYPG